MPHVTPKAAAQSEVTVGDDSSSDQEAESVGRHKRELVGKINSRPAKVHRCIQPSGAGRTSTALTTGGSEAIRSSVLNIGPVAAGDPVPMSFLTWNVNGLTSRVRATQWRQFAEYCKKVLPVSCMCQQLPSTSASKISA